MQCCVWLQIRFFTNVSLIDKLVKSKDRLGFVPQPNLQVTVINQHLNYIMLCLLSNPIFYELIRFIRHVLFVTLYSVSGSNRLIYFNPISSSVR